MDVDRPLECSECKKTVQVNYSEIVGSKVVKRAMCVDCPVLMNKMRRPDDVAGSKGMLTEKQSTMSCGVCGTSMEEIRMGYNLGCADCYETFSDLVLSHLIANGGFFGVGSDSETSYHVGRIPGDTGEISPSLRLIVLNEALKETLTREDYEQAAWIRDQINKIEDGGGDGKDIE